MSGSARQRVIFLGNCVAERLQGMIRRCPGFDRSYILEPAPMIHTLRLPGDEAALAALARKALACERIFTQPLFNYGDCNTSALRERLKPGRDVTLFSSPHFPAYFPDAVEMKKAGPSRLPPVLDWDSSIIFSCYAAGVPVLEVEGVYLDHPLFREAAVKARLLASLEACAGRERDLDLSSAAWFFRRHAATRLLHSPRHPVDDFLRHMLGQVCAALELAPPDHDFAIDGFGFNRWPIITRHHRLFSFAEQAFFVIAGKCFSIEDVAMACYNVYSFHPALVEANRDKVIPLV